MTAGRKLATLTLAALMSSSCGSEGPSPYLTEARGDYLGDTPPGREMKIFAPGLVAFGTHEHHFAFTPDGGEMYWVIADRYRQHHTIIEARREGDVWLRPEVAPFSGEFNDFAPTPTPDGRSFLFCSNRPLPGEGPDAGDVNIWKMDRSPEGWGEPYPLPGEVNDESGEYNPTVALDGTLYFQDFDGESEEIYRARLVDGGYGPPEKVEALSSPYADAGPLILPDGKTLIFSSGRPGGEGDLDFWVSYQGEDGSWSEPLNMGPAINTPADDATITLSQDGKYFFFTNFLAIDPDRLKHKPYAELVRILDSPENGDGTTYWISSEILDGLEGCCRSGVRSRTGGSREGTLRQ